MPNIPPDVIEQIRNTGARLILDLIRADGGKIKNPHHTKPSCTCTFHHDKHPSAQIFPGSGGGFKCYTCGAHCSDVFDYLSKKHLMTFPEAVREIAKRTNLSHLIPRENS